MNVRRVGPVATAVQWNQPGDHPDVRLAEGTDLHYYGLDSEKIHGLIRIDRDERTVHVGDWIINERGRLEVVSPEALQRYFEIVLEAATPEASAEVATKRGGELARVAACLIQNPRFFDWLHETGHWPGYCAKSEAVKNSNAWLREICHITSKRDLDHDTQAAARFHALVRKPFVAWNLGETK